MPVVVVTGVIKSLQDEMKEMKEEHERTSRSFKDEAEASYVRCSKLMEDLSVSKNVSMSAKVQLESLEVNNNELSEKLEATKEELRTLKAGSEETLRDRARTITELRGEVAELKQQSSSFAATKRSEIDNLKERNDGLSRALEEEREGRRVDEGKAQESLEALELKESEFNASINSANAKLRAAAEEVAGLKESLSAAKNSSESDATKFASEMEDLRRELDNEVKRANGAEREKNRISSDFESLKRKFDRMATDLDSRTSALADKTKTSEETSREVWGLKRKLDLSIEKAKDLEREMKIVRGDLETSEITKDELNHKLNDALKLHSDSAKEVGALKKSVQLLKDDVAEADAATAALRSKAKEDADLVSDRDKALLEKEQMISELSTKVAQLQECEDGRGALESRAKSLEAELDKCLVSIANDKQSQLEAERTLTAESLKAQRFHDQVSGLTSDLDMTKTEVATLRETLKSVRATNLAKDEVVDAANKKADVALAGREAIERELGEMRESFRDLTKSKRLAESESMSAKRECDASKIELEECRNKLRRVETELAELRSEAGVGEEVAVLRSQLSKMKKEMLGGEEGIGDGDWSGGAGSPRKHKLNQTSIVESKREKELYEKVISNLRAELQNEADTRRNLISDLNAAKREAAIAASAQDDLEEARAKVRHLEEEVANCEVEVARSRRNELNAVAISSEAERNLDKKADDSELLRGELKECQGQVISERARADRYAKVSGG